MSNHELEFPFFSFLTNLSLGLTYRIGYFNSNDIFWSFSRLLGVYDRIISACLSYDEEKIVKPFLEEDVENFIIRFRVVLNDLAYALRNFYPSNLRGFPGLKGGVHPLNREFSFFDFFKFIKENPSFHQDLNEVFVKNESNLKLLRRQRDNIIHYKSKVIIFSKDVLEFAIFSNANDELTEKTSDGRVMVITTPVFSFVNSQVMFLYKFINEDMLNVYQKYAITKKLTTSKASKGSFVTCQGTNTFIKINKL